MNTHEPLRWEEEVERAELFAREPWRAVLWKAADWLEQHGLVMGYAFDDEDGRGCGICALQSVEKDREKTHEALTQFLRRSGEHTMSGWVADLHGNTETAVAKLREVALTGA